MARTLREIAVENSAGEQLLVFEREVIDRVPIANLRRKMIGFELSSGELVEYVDEHSFILSETDEKLSRIGEVRRTPWRWRAPPFVVQSPLR